MKKYLIVFLPVLLAMLFMGAVTPPVEHTRSFYVNDYANFLVPAHREEIIELSAQLYEETGIQVVVLTVDSMYGRDIDAYIEAVIDGWNIGGENRDNAVLLLVAKNEMVSRVAAAPEILAHHREDQVDMTIKNASKAIMNVYRPVMLDAFNSTGASLSEEQRASLEKQTGGKKSFGMSTVVIFGVLALIVVRAFRVSGKYRRKYAHTNTPYVRRHRVQQESGDREENYQQSKQEKIYSIKYDDMD